MTKQERDPFQGRSGALAVTAIAGIAAILASIVRSKVAALVLGPAGVGTIAEVTQFISVLAFPLGISSGPALITALARRAESVQEARRAVQTAITLSAFAGLAIACISVAIGLIVFREDKDSLEFLALIILASLNAGLNALLGVGTAALIALGHPEVSARVSIRQNVLSALLPSIATIMLGVVGQLAGLALALLVSIPTALHRLWSVAPELKAPREPFDWRFLRAGLVLGVAGLFAAATNQFLYTGYRALAHASGGVEANGQLQAALSISSAYFGFVLASLGAIAFPAYAAAVDAEQLTGVVNSTIRQVLRLVPPVILFSFAFCRPAMTLLYSGQFSPASEILAIQMAGDLPKAVAWGLGGPLLLRGHARAFMVAEALASGALLASATLLVPRLGLIGFGFSYFLGYSIAVMTNAVVLTRATGARIPWGACAAAVGCAGLLAAASAVENRIIVEVIAATIGAIWAAKVGGLALLARVYARAKSISVGLASRLFRSSTLK